MFIFIVLNIQAVLVNFLLQITFLSPETRTHKLQFSKHDKPLLYHPTHRKILFYHAGSAWHVTSPSQGLSSTRGKSLGTRLSLYWLNTHLIGSSGRLNASDWLMVVVVDVTIRLNISNLEKAVPNRLDTLDIYSINTLNPLFYIFFNTKNQNSR